MRPQKNRLRSRRPDHAWFLLVAAMLGPYLAGGLRTEQLVVYLATAPAMIYMARSRRIIRTDAALAAIPMLNLLIFIGGLASTDFGVTSIVVAAPVVDNFLFAFAVTIVPVALLWRGKSGGLDKLAWVLVGILALHSVLMVLQFVGFAPPAIPWFHAAPEHRLSVAERSASLGRYVGIFVQPSSAGFAYGVALLCVVYLYRRFGMSWYLALCAIGCFVGGLLPVSKVFMLGAVPLAAGLAVSMIAVRRGGSGYAAGVLSGVALGVTMLFLVPLFLDAVPGSDTLSRVMRVIANFDDIAVATGGRYQDASPVVELTRHLFENAPILGYGFQPFGFAADNTAIWYLAHVGHLGLVLIIMIVPIVLSVAVRARGVEGLFLAALVVLGVVTATAGPVTIYNRAAGIYFLVLMCAMSKALAQIGGRQRRTVRRTPGSRRCVKGRQGRPSLPSWRSPGELRVHAHTTRHL